MMDEFNLQTFPFLEGETKNIVQFMEYHAKVEAWKEGFEKHFKELDIMEWLDANHPQGEAWAKYGGQFTDTLRIFIEKEILGVDNQVSLQKKEV